MSNLTWRGKIGLAMVFSPPLLGVGAMLFALFSQAPVEFFIMLAVFAWFGAGMFLWITGVK